MRDLEAALELETDEDSAKAIRSRIKKVGADLFAFLSLLVPLTPPPLPLLVAGESGPQEVEEEGPVRGAGGAAVGQRRRDQDGIPQSRAPVASGQAGLQVRHGEERRGGHVQGRVG